MSGKDWQTRLARRWERRLASRSPVDMSGRSISGESWHWRLTVSLLMVLLVVAVGVSGGPKAALVLVALYASFWVCAWWWNRRQLNRLGAAALLMIGMERSTGWGKAGFTWEFGRQGRRTDNPASWLKLCGPHADAVLTVWSSGDAQVDSTVEGDTLARHYLVSSVEDLKACLDDLEATVRGNH